MDSNATPVMPANIQETEARGTRSRVPRACYQCSKMKKACDNNIPCTQRDMSV
ncbi:hypothetical protein BJY01DRAFT_220797 [Aspergillus pseudoustus]|uniref:Zn(2)-C6 fungal-type domain-containing protein n=1 Tax=Aspergillus pseudoustus TaxID=1810923 RepID=A0ABR4JEM5_9EURO